VTRRILVIGGDGFLGRHVVRRLIGGGSSVAVFDRFSSGGGPDGARRIVGDFRDHDAVAAAVRGQDVVLHLLSTTTPVSAAEDPIRDVEENVVGTLRLLEALRDADVPRLVFASTGGAIYGEGDGRAHLETDSALPVTPYAIGKLATERHLEFASRLTPLEATSLRISNPYGPGQRPGKQQGVIPIALRRVREGRPVTRLGDGGAVRDYLYVEDAAAMIAAVTEGAPRHRLYNIGSGSGVRLDDVFEVVGRVSGLPLELVEQPAPAHFVRHSVLDVTRFAEEFGTSPLVPLEEGVERTWRSILEE
jgi:UDP-glucose 4-epimerase